MKQKTPTKFRHFFCRVDDNPNFYKIHWDQIKPSNSIRYALICFHETGKNQRPHYHIYIETKITQRKSYIHKFLKIPDHGVSNSIQKAHNTEDCIEYIRNPLKTNEIQEFGKLQKQGNRTDIQKVINQINKGQTDTQIIINPKVNSTWVKYSNHFGKVRKLIDKARAQQENYNRERIVESFIFWGATGKGKTDDALHSFLDSHKLNYNDVYMVPRPKQKNNLWFDDYENEPVIVFDEFDENWVDSDTLKHLTDRWIHQFPIKGSFIYSFWKYVIFTTNYEPSTWKMEWTPSLLRRIPKEHWFKY